MAPETIIQALDQFQGLVFSLGCVLTFALGWIAGHQR